MKLTGWIRGIGSIVAYSPELSKILGVKETVLLCQLIWWRENEPLSSDGGLHKNRDEIHEATGLSKYEQDGACKRLQNFGVLRTQYRISRNQKYYYIHDSKLKELWEKSQTHSLAPSQPAKSQIREIEKTDMAKSHFPTSRDSEIPFRHVEKHAFNKKRLKKENNKDKTTDAQKTEIERALNLLGFPPDDTETFVSLLNLNNQYPDPDLWISNIEYTAKYKPDDPVAYLVDSLRNDYARSLRATTREARVTITLPPPGAEILYHGQDLLVDEDHFVRNKQGDLVLPSGLFYQELKAGTVTVKV